MEILSSLPDKIRWVQSAVAIGKFDGLHRGHAKILSALSDCQDAQTRTVVFAFQMGGEPIVPADLWRKRIASFGIDVLIEHPFAREIRNLSPEEFAEKILFERLHCKTVVVGEDFRYGKNRLGDAATLLAAGEKYGFSLRLIPKLNDGGTPISSTRIRRLLAAGERGAAEHLLGYKLP